MKQYLDMLRRIKAEGNDKGNRTKTWAKSIFGHQMRFNLKEGFPLVTTKFVSLRAVAEELFWFLRGSTNNEDLVARKVHIWDEWALPCDHIQRDLLTEYQRYDIANSRAGIGEDTRTKCLTAMEHYNALDRLGLAPTGWPPGMAEGRDCWVVTNERTSFVLDLMGIPRYSETITHKKGDLGPIYGKQWRDWRGPDGASIDQIAYVINQLKTTPNDRRMIVTAWNPSDMPDGSISPQENVVNGKMALAACHCMFQLYTRPMTLHERISWVFRSDMEEAKIFRAGGTDAEQDAFYDEMGVPKHALSCLLYQRSCDSFLGVPYNIASYALLTHMLAQVCNMVPDEFIWTGGDVHIYSNHFDQVDLQLSRDPKPMPKLRLNPAIKDIDAFTWEDITLENYDHWPSIKGEVSV